MGLPEGLAEEVYRKIYAGHFERYLANMQEFFDSEVEALAGNDNELRGLEKCRNLFLSSFFVSIYNFLESELTGECALSDRKLKNYKGNNSDIAAALECLKDLDYEVTDNTAWEQIDGSYRHLRNCIVHCSGILDNCTHSEKLGQYIHDNSMMISISSSGVILLSADFCEKALDTMMQFLVSVIFSRT